MPTEARGNYLPEPPYLRETKTYHSQPLESTRHASWQLFRPVINTAHFYFLLLQKLCQITWLLTGWEIFFYFRRPLWGLRPVAFTTSATWLIRHWQDSYKNTGSYRIYRTAGITAMRMHFADDIYLIIPAVNVDSRSAEFHNVNEWALANNLNRNLTKSQ